MKGHGGFRIAAATALACAPLSAQLKPEVPTGSLVKQAPTKVSSKDALHPEGGRALHHQPCAAQSGSGAGP